MSAGDYPAGAENDPRAPWNQDLQDCPNCDGTGQIKGLDHTDDGEYTPTYEDCDVCDGSGTVDYNDRFFKKFMKERELNY